MGETFLTVKEIAGLRKCSEQHIRKQILQKKIAAEEVDGLCTGQGGKTYKIPLSKLPERIQILYMKAQKAVMEKEVCSPSAEPAEGKAFNYEQLTGEERENLFLWKDILRQWNDFRFNSNMKKGEADSEFLVHINEKYPKIGISLSTLYRKKYELQNNGESALIDLRGKHKSFKSKLTTEMKELFEYFYLHGSKKKITECLKAMRRELTLMKSESADKLPTVRTLQRYAAEIPLPYVLYFREGEKKYISKCEPYIRRMYSDIKPNDIWVADNHTMDLFIQNNEKPIRVYLTAFMDVRSRMFTGIAIALTPCGDATILALRNGIEKFGIPKCIYTDNGREFLFHDFGGSGFRKKAAEGEKTEQPTILKELGIEFRTALPRNARAKGIERAFETVKEQFSKYFESYSGGNISEKPDALKNVLKNPEKLHTFEEFSNIANAYIFGEYNEQPHNGDGMYGKTPEHVWGSLLEEKITATQEQLNLMFMRWSRAMKVGKNGISLRINGERIEFGDKDLWLKYFGKSVYIRYNPQDLSEIRVYDMDEKFICTAKQDERISYFADKETLQRLVREKRENTKLVLRKRTQLKQAEIKALRALVSSIQKTDKDYDYVIRPIGQPLLMASGGETYEDLPKPEWSVLTEHFEKGGKAVL